MATPTKVPIDHPSVLQRWISPYSLAVTAIAALALLTWGILKVFQRLPHLSAWEVPLGIATVALVALAVVWKVPQWQVGKVRGLEPKERFDRVNEARKTLAQIIGGLAVLAGFYSTVQNLKATQDGQMLAQKSFTLAQEGQITDRFSKAVEQLGAVDSSGRKKLEVRLGGVYALQRIANESEEEHWPIMEVLTAYIRDNAPRRERKPPVKPAIDIEAITEVIRTRNLQFEHSDGILNLRQADMSWAQLVGAHLNGADLTQAKLTRAELAQADLSGTSLMEADLSESLLPLANLSGADMDGADLGGANLAGANLSGASLIRANMIDANFNAAKLAGANLIQADLTGANLFLADLSGAFLFYTDLSNANNLTQEQIDSAKGNDRTELPSNLHMPEAWKKGSLK